MSREITLNALIEKLKVDLFSPYLGTANEGKVAYPIFFIDEVELKLAVTIEYDVNTGIKVTIPQLVEGNVGAGETSGSAHTMKLKLSPILEREEMRALMDEDERLMEGVREATLLAVRRGSKLAGE